MNKLLHQPQIEDEEDLCVICLDRKRAAVLVPCGHAQSCLECGLQWADTGPNRPGREAASATCPLCRDTIEQVIPCTERPLMELDIDDRYHRYCF